jgi:hypothetical protein
MTLEGAHRKETADSKTGDVIQNYWVFGLCPSCGILETRKYNVSETGYVSVLRYGGKTLLGPSARANLNHWTTPVRFTTVI